MNMSQESVDQRLSHITTLWTLLQDAHGEPADARFAAQRLLMQRYCRAVYRYLAGALRDDEAAMELFQEFALRFLRGDFHRADPERGRFRDYVKTALIHLVSEHHRARRAQPGPLPAEVAAPSEPDDSDARFLASWREELINRSWQALEKAKPAYHVVLLFHVQQPEAAASEAAAQLTAHFGKSFTADHARVVLHRARHKFGDLLLAEVAESLESPTEDQLLHELEALGLRKLCVDALKRRR